MKYSGRSSRRCTTLTLTSSSFIIVTCVFITLYEIERIKLMPVTTSQRLSDTKLIFLLNFYIREIVQFGRGFSVKVLPSLPSSRQSIDARFSSMSPWTTAPLFTSPSSSLLLLLLFVVIYTCLLFSLTSVFQFLIFSCLHHLIVNSSI